MAHLLEKNINPGRIDRSKCLFPVSSRDTHALGRGSVRTDLLRPNTSLSTHFTGETKSATLKAAWILTLQCFVVADVLCFRYEGSTRDVQAFDGQDAKEILALYAARLDRSESVQSLVTRFGRSEQAIPARDPAGYDINIVEADSTQHQCNTAVCYRMGKTLATKDTIHQDIDLRIVVTESSENGILIELDYSLSHTDQDMAESVLNTFQHIFTQMLNAPSALLIQDVDLCAPSDQKKIRNFTSNVSPVKEQCLHDMILAQCKQRPNQIAVRSWDGDMTYGELDDLSSRLAFHLVKLGVRPETFVLSCFEKSTWAIVARLAILRAGGAYISIHASNPPAYLKSIIVRTDTKILLTDSTFVNQFRNFVLTTVELSPEWIRNLPVGTDSIICHDIKPDNACLVLFTSGSTGTPKGITQIHSSYATAIQDYARNLRLGSHTRFLHFDDYAFDISNLEFLVPLILGGVCCVPAPMKTVEDLASQIRTLEANIIFLTPTVAIKLEPSEVPSLEIMCVGGEPVPKDLIHKWASHSTRLINQYGMGEVAICCAYNDRVDRHEGSKIGRPSSGAIWIVDQTSPEKLLPIGAIGEFIIEGPHLSRGYIDATALHRSDAGFLKTIPRWLGELHPDRAQFRMYRSGDLGRLGADGTITYLGRKDTILKLDGCRVDALEVEHQARKFLSDKDTIVADLLGIIDGQADPSLTAFLYLDNHPVSTAPIHNETPLLIDAMSDLYAKEKVEEIKRGIGLSLPRYMIPTTFVLMSWIPRTASKKIDRKKMHVLGQVFYSVISERRTKDMDYAQRMKMLPI